MQIPFLAEAQRTAIFGHSVAQEELLPSDIVVQFADLAWSSDGRHNHVALVIGWDDDGVPLLLESRPQRPVQLVRLDAFAHHGGFRRFSPNPMVAFSGPCVEESLALARRVPKTGRVGSKQRLVGQGTLTRKHYGVDIYCKPGTGVYAPVAGLLDRVEQTGEVDECAVLVAHDQKSKCFLANVRLLDDSSRSKSVLAGELIGYVVQTRRDAAISLVEHLGMPSHLHLEFASQEDILFSFGLFGHARLHRESKEGWHYYNALYLCKIGYISLPVRV